MDLSLLKYALKIVIGLGGRASKLKNKRTRAPIKKKRRRVTRLLKLVVVLFVGIGLIVVSIAAFGFGRGGNTIQPASNESNVLDQAQAIEARRASGASLLTAYPDNSMNLLSSATIDEQTGKQSYMRDMGSGGVASSAATTPDDCQLPSQVGKYGLKTDGNDNPCTPDTNADFLIGDGSGTSGALFVIPPSLTTESGPIQSLMNVMQTVAWLFLAPIIALIGLSIITGAGRWNFADLLEALPRLLFSALAVSLSLVVAEAVLLFANDMTALFMSALHSSGIPVADVSSVVYPADKWMKWLHFLMGIGLTLLLAPVIAPISIFGTDIGAYIAIPAAIAANVLLIVHAPDFVLNSLSMIIGVEVMIRILLINLYVILSPLAMISAGIPGRTGVGFARDWAMGFLGLVASQFAQVAVLGIGLVVQATYVQQGGKTSDIIYLFLKYGILLLMIRVPGLFKSNAAELMKQVGPTVASGVQQQKVIFMP